MKDLVAFLMCIPWFILPMFLICVRPSSWPIYEYKNDEECECVECIRVFAQSIDIFAIAMIWFDCSKISYVAMNSDILITYFLTIPQASSIKNSFSR